MRYLLRGLASDGSLVRVELEAHDERDAGEQASKRGLAVLTLRRHSALPGLIAARSARFALLPFSQELLALLQSGISLVEAIQTLLEKEQRPEARRTLNDLIERLRQGQAMSAALQQAPQTFPPIYVAAVRAAENSGDLPEALSRYVTYQSQVDSLRRKLVHSAIYPTLLIGVGILVTMFLLGYVVPRFSGIYEDMGGKLPWLSMALLTLGKFIEAHALGLGLCAVTAAAIVARWLTRPESAQTLLALAWRVPAIGESMRMYQLARFYRTLGMLLRGGIAVIPALGEASGLLQHSLRPGLDHAARLVSEGKALSSAMEAAGLSTPVASRMLRVGERTGAMGDMMERIAVFHEEDLARRSEWLTRLFEPLLMAAVGLVIGLVVLLLYLPIFDLAGNIQ